MVEIDEDVIVSLLCEEERLEEARKKRKNAMDKLLALHNEEQRDEQRFRETIIHRDHILKTKSEMENLEKQIQKITNEINVTEPQIYQVETDLKMMETQLEEITKNINRSVEKMLKAENKLRRSKQTFQNFLREKIERNKELLNLNQTKDGTNYSNIEQEETAATQRRVWILQGNIEALEVIEKYQTKKIEEINHIINVVGEPLRQPIEENESTKV